MAKDRTLKKVTKVMTRVEKHIEATRDALEDLEIEFEVLKATVKRLKASDTSEEPVDQEVVIDMENTSAMRKF
ncbi:MAG: hypothetical protein CMA86_00105 [Euryarchaeota archaeon]|nr:hypothetical protein [Euryarchaeota archaeon]|tara:strand:- start:312 stop:530 length:219 start_codon:yes stop_codon:yes gene_type:complete